MAAGDAGELNFRMPQAVSVYTEQTAENYMNTHAPLAISSDGRKVAYYRESGQRFAVRDLATGNGFADASAIPRATMVEGGGLVRLSPDGRFLAIAVQNSPIVLVDIETAQVTEAPAAGTPSGSVTAVTRSSSPTTFGQLEGGRVTVLALSGGDLRAYGEPSADGRVLPCLDGAKASKTGMNSREHDTIVTLDPPAARS